MEQAKSRNNLVLCRLDYKEGKFLQVCVADREGKCDVSFNELLIQCLNPYSG